MPVSQTPIPIDLTRLTALTPPKHLPDFQPITPIDYYLTTGEIVSKTTQLVKDIEGQATRLLQHPMSPETNAYGKAVLVSLSQARDFLAEMIKLRGDWLWLESDWAEDGLIGRRKTSREVKRPSGKPSHGKPPITVERST